MGRQLKLQAFLAFWLFIAPAFPANAGELVVSAAASLTNAFQELATAYEVKNPGTRVLLNFGASGGLLQQIANGAPADLFASADQETMDRASQKGLLEGSTRKNFAGNGLVLITPLDSKLNPTSLGDLANPEYRKISLGDPGFVPAGRYALQALATAKLDEALRPRLIFGANVRQVLDYVVRGEVDAGFVFGTDAMLQKGKIGKVLTVEGYQPILYPISVLAESAQKEEARKFLDFVLSAEGRGYLARHGFKIP